MIEPAFDHERLDVYRLSIEYKYEYRDAEYEYEEMPEPRVARELPKLRL